MQALYLL